ncbi:MAG: SLBB domain-containing protein [Bacteroidales bacterium]|nr:SLBB domain-containing protein [Bacteroidales bacterium]
MKRIITAFACVLLSLTALAQSANIMVLARGELQKRGLNEMEVRTRLHEEGIDVDSIPSSEYPAYQSRVMAILNTMQAEKEAAAKGAPVIITDTTDAIEIAAPEDVTDLFPQTTEGESAAEVALEKALKENDVDPNEGKDIYGHALFKGKSLDVFRTTDGAQAPDTYVLGEGDEVHISIFGSSQTEIHQRIGLDGSIQPAGASKIFLKGMTLAQAREVIRTKLSQHYSFRPDQIAVTLTTARTVTVSIYGEVGVQGGFTLSALNTVFNALVAAGGPSEIGSLREIQLSRSGKSYKLDFYKYMTKPATGLNYDLQNGDVLYVPVAQKIVSIDGPVNRPMRYEMTEGETLLDLINYAGGLTSKAYPDFVQIERKENGEVNYLEYDLKTVMNGTKKVALSRGDIVRLRTSNKPLENYVEIQGDVYYAGRFDLEKNSSLKGLIDKAVPTYTAKTDYVFVERTRPDETVEVMTVPFPGVNGNPDFQLEGRDVVRVLTQSTYRDVETIQVSGQVRNPFTKEFGLNDRMTVSQAIEYAGGLKPSVFPVAYIFRKDISNPVKMQYLPINLEKDGDTLLQPGDNLNVYDNTTYTNVGEIRVSGAVKNPASITFDSSLTLHDVISMTGGFDLGAAYDRVEVFRMNMSKTGDVKYQLLTISVDDNYNPSNPNFQLQPFDHIVVRRLPHFSASRTVEINGRVRYPGVYSLDDGRTPLSKIIEMAGGLLDDADPYTTVFRVFHEVGNIAVNLKDVKTHKGNTKYDPVLMDGDVINVRRQQNTVTIRETGTRMAQYIPADFSSLQKHIVYQGPRSAKWYLNQYAGGMIPEADPRSITVTLPNYQSIGTRKFLFFYIYPKVEPGSTVTLTVDQSRKEKENKPKEKIDWERLAASSLQSLTSIVSMIVLIERLN